MTFSRRARRKSESNGRGGLASAAEGDARSGPLAEDKRGAAPAVNPSWQAMTIGVQPKLSVSAPGDPDELEADRVADAVVNDTAAPAIRQSASTISRKCAACAGSSAPCPKCEEEERAQRKAVDGGGTIDASAISPLAGGSELPPEDRSFFESGIGHDFSDVRIHTDSAANSSSSAINARA